MKTVSHLKLIFLLLGALGLAAGPLLPAEDKPAEPAPVVAPAAPAAPDAPPAPDAPATEVAEEKPLRELTAAESKKDEEAESAPDDNNRDKRHSRRYHNNERVSFFSNSTLAEGEEAEVVISIIGSSTSAGDVRDGVVSIIGGSTVRGGTVGDSVVSVLGNTYVNGHVRGEVVGVLGNVELGPKAIVDGEVVCIGGQLTRDKDSVVNGDVHNVAVAGRNFNFTGLTTWFHECFMYARPLAFHRDLLWAWGIAFGLLGFYVLIALITPTGVVKCAETLEDRPGYSLLSALLTLLLTPVVYILLAFTLAIAVGFVLIPVFSFGLFIAAIFGKVVMLAWLGRRFTKLLGDGPLAHPVFGVLLGGLIVLGIYTVPILGFIVYKLLGILGLGVVVYTIIRQVNASRPPKPVLAAAAMAAPAGIGAPEPAASAGFAGAVPPPLAPPVVSAVTLPRAGFWIRTSAAFLDFVLVFIASLILLHGILNYHGGPGFNFLLWLAYHPIMWKLKGTTIGGIICGLKVVRLDDRPIDWGVAVVRSLTAFMSFCLAGLGFIWVAFDDEKQSWHDKVAGTTIVKVPKGMALL